MSERAMRRQLELGTLPFSGLLVAYILLMALAAGGVCAYIALEALASAPNYPDFIVGAISWQASSKLQDLASYPAFLLGFLGCGWSLTQVFKKVTATGNGLEQDLISVLFWWFVPVAIGIGSFFSPYPSSPLFAIVIGLFGSMLTITLERVHFSIQKLTPIELGVGVLGIIFLALFPYAIAAIFDRLPIPDFSPRRKIAPLISGALGLVSTVYLIYLVAANKISTKKFISKILLISQIGLGIFYILIVPDLYIAGVDKLAIQASTSIWALAIALIIAAIYDSIQRYKNFTSENQKNYFELLSPLAIFATILLLRNGQTFAPHISTDDYHFGESLLGWWGFWQYNILPYVGLISPHGMFGDDIGGFFSLVFYDGTAASMAEANRLAATMTMLVAFLAMRWYTKSIGLAYISILMFGAIARKLFFLVLVPFFCLWFKYPNDGRPRNWLWWWMISVVFLILAVPPQGLIAAVASLPAVGLYFYRARKLQWTRDVIALLLISGAIIIFTPIPAMLKGAVWYVIENGPINQIAYGIPWSWSWGGPPSNTIKIVALEILRMSWILIPITASSLILMFIRRRETWGYLATVALPVLIFVSLLTAYALGRIDPMAISRPGLLSNFALTILLPILLSPLMVSRGKAVMAIGIGFICGGLGLANISRAGLSDILIRNEVGNLWSGEQHHLGNMGTGLVDANHAEDLIKINTFLSKNLQPHESYLDMTGHNARYMYFDRPPPIAITAPYNLAPIAQQRLAVDRLSRNLPRVALLEANNMNFDGGGPALRSHMLYRFVLNNYLAELHGGYVYGFASPLKVKRPTISFSIKDFTDANWLHGIHRADAALIIDDDKTVRYLRVDDLVNLPDGKAKRISKVWVEGNAIWFDGAPLDSKVFETSSELGVKFDSTRRTEFSANLMQQTFAVPDLQKVPVAWGRSGHSLDKVMQTVMNLNLDKVGLHDLTLTGSSLQPIGSDPYLWFDLSDKKLSGQSAGILSFDFACQGAEEARLQVFWWGDDMLGSNATQSLRMTAANGRLIVPLDSYPNWLQMQHVKGLRIDLDSVAACQTFSIKNSTLKQRNFR